MRMDLLMSWALGVGGVGLRASTSGVSPQSLSKVQIVELGLSLTLPAGKEQSWDYIEPAFPSLADRLKILMSFLRCHRLCTKGW